MLGIRESEWAGHYDIEVSEIEVMSDHIHFLATAPPRKDNRKQAPMLGIGVFLRTWQDVI
jgi:REP element-mobilizing transposase RayT